jgi:hypothetical protein
VILSPSSDYNHHVKHASHPSGQEAHTADGMRHGVQHSPLSLDRIQSIDQLLDLRMPSDHAPLQIIASNTPQKSHKAQKANNNTVS